MFLCTRCVHAFTCAGIIPSQYINSSCFSGIGTVVQHDSTANAYHTTVPCPSGR